MSLLRSLQFWRQYPPALRANFIHLYFDIGWWGFYAGATVAFLNVYAVRVGATPVQIGLLSALPAAISLVISLPTGSLIRNLPAMRVTFWSALVGRAMFLSYVLIPFLPIEAQVPAILIVAVIFALPNAVVSISFSEFIMEAVPADWRGVVVGARFAIFAIISFFTTLVCGQILSSLAFPANYQVVFAIGFVSGVMTAFHISRVRRVVEPVTGAVAAPGMQTLARRRQLLPRVDADGRRYLRVIWLLFFFNTSNSMVAPLVPEVMVNRLQLSDSVISIGTATSSMLVFLVSLFIARLTRRTGNRNATALGAVVAAGQAVALALANTPLLYLLSAVIGGLGSGLLFTAQYNYHLENVPAQDRTIWLSWNLLLSNTALLIGSLLGPAAAALSGVPLALLLFALLRFGAGLIFWKFG